MTRNHALREQVLKAVVINRYHFVRRFGGALEIDVARVRRFFLAMAGTDFLFRPCAWCATLSTGARRGLTFSRGFIGRTVAAFA